MDDHNHGRPLLAPEGPDWSTKMAAAFVVAIFVIAAMWAALNGWPAPLVVVHWLALVAAIWYAASAVYQGINGNLEEAAFAALKAVALLLAWYLTGPAMGWPQPERPAGHWDVP
jgi:hypothetical protein